MKQSKNRKRVVYDASRLARSFDPVKRSSTEGSLTETFNMSGVRLWT